MDSHPNPHDHPAASLPSPSIAHQAAAQLRRLAGSPQTTRDFVRHQPPPLPLAPLPQHADHADPELADHLATLRKRRHTAAQHSADTQILRDAWLSNPDKTNHDSLAIFDRLLQARKLEAELHGFPARPKAEMPTRRGGQKRVTGPVIDIESLSQDAPTVPGAVFHPATVPEVLPEAPIHGEVGP